MSGTNGLGTTSATIANGSPIWVTGNAKNGPPVGAAFFLSPVLMPPIGQPAASPPSPFLAGVEYYVIAAVIATGTFQLSLTPGGAAITATQAGQAGLTPVVAVLQSHTSGAVEITNPTSRPPQAVPEPYSAFDESYQSQRVSTGTFGLTQVAVPPSYAPPTIPH